MGQIREVSHSEWAELAVPDVYFSLEYHTASMWLEQNVSKTTLLEWKDALGTVRLPLILRSIEGTRYLDATSAYGYGGPWLEGTPDVEDFVSNLDNWAAANNVVCTFLRFHPLLKNVFDFQEHMPTFEMGPTAGWDLKGTDDPLTSMSKGHRKTYRRAIRAGVVARITLEPQDLGEFRRLYSLSMDRLSASGFYRFSERYWDSVSKSLEGSTVLVEAIHEGRAVATVLCLKSEKFLHYHLSGTSDEGRQLGGAVVCRLAAAQWGKEQGLQLAHSGGGLGGSESSLLDWKRKFDENLPLFQFHIGKLVHLREAYAELSAKFSDQSFFPPWRSP